MTYQVRKVEKGEHAGPGEGQPETIVVGYGNTLRGDDGAGRVLAEMIGADPRAARVRVFSWVQLAPELAIDLAEARRVVFIDASSELRPGETSMRPIGGAGASTAPGSRSPAADARALTHQMTPQAVLELARTLYGATPEAAILSIGIESTELNTELSETVRAALPAALEAVFGYLAGGR